MAFFWKYVRILDAASKCMRFRVQDAIMWPIIFFFLRPWTQECHVQWTQETWKRNNKIVCFYANLLRLICCVDQSGESRYRKANLGIENARVRCQMLVSVCHDNGYKFQNVQARGWPGGGGGGSGGPDPSEFFSTQFLCQAICTQRIP